MILFVERLVGNNPKVTIEAHSKEHLLNSTYMKLRWGDMRKSFDFSEDGRVKFISEDNKSGLIGYWMAIE